MRGALNAGMLTALLKRLLQGMQNPVGERSCPNLSLSLMHSIISCGTHPIILLTIVNDDVLRAVAGSVCQVQMSSHILLLVSEMVTTVRLQRDHLFRTMF